MSSIVDSDSTMGKYLFVARARFELKKSNRVERRVDEFATLDQLRETSHKRSRNSWPPKVVFKLINDMIEDH